jgi:hypothetical protein
MGHQHEEGASMSASRRMVMGGVTLALGVALVAIAAGDLFGATRTARAGELEVDCTQAGISPTAIPSATPDPTAVITDFQALQQIPTCTPTVVIRRTRTPSPEPTEEPTQTSEPAPTERPAPSATQPSGGAGAGVQAPDTGTGAAAGGSPALMWVLLSAGAALAAMGAGAVVAGARKRTR